MLEYMVGERGDSVPSKASMMAAWFFRTRYFDVERSDIERFRRIRDGWLVPLREIKLKGAIGLAIRVACSVTTINARPAYKLTDLETKEKWGNR